MKATEREQKIIRLIAEEVRYLKKAPCDNVAEYEGIDAVDSCIRQSLAVVDPELRTMYVSLVEPWKS